MTSASDEENKGFMLDITFKHIDIIISQIQNQHNRLQEEVYVRLKSRVNISNYLLLTTGGFFSVVGFLITRSGYTHIRDFLMSASGHDMGMLSFVTFSFGMIFTLLLLGFVNHSGNIYVASNFIETNIAALVHQMERKILDLKTVCGIQATGDPFVLENLYTWEKYLSFNRRQHGITSTNFEGVAAIFMSIGLFIMYFLLSVFSMFLIIQEPPTNDYVRDRLLPIGFVIFFVIGLFFYGLMLVKVGSSYRSLRRYHRRLGTGTT